MVSQLNIGLARQRSSVLLFGQGWVRAGLPSVQVWFGLLAATAIPCQVGIIYWLRGERGFYHQLPSIHDDVTCSISKLLFSFIFLCVKWCHIL